MKIAIVGASKLTKNNELGVRQLCGYLMQQQPYSSKPHCVISGGAKGVDTIAIEIAKALGLDTEEYFPGIDKWEDTDGKRGYKSRNLEIVEACDMLYCIAIPFHNVECYHHSVEPYIKHEVTGGCWTMKQAVKANKETKFFITTDRLG